MLTSSDASKTLALTSGLMADMIYGFMDKYQNNLQLRTVNSVFFI